MLEEDVGNYNNDLQYNFDTGIMQKNVAKRDSIAMWIVDLSSLFNAYFDVNWRFEWNE